MPASVPPSFKPENPVDLCYFCRHRKMDLEHGLLCSLTNQKNTNLKCPEVDIEIDRYELAAEKQARKEISEKKLQIKRRIVYAVVALLVILPIVGYVANQYLKQRRLINESLALAAVFENSDFAAIASHIEGKVAFARLPNAGRIGNLRSLSENSVKEYFEEYADDKMVSFRSYYLDQQKHVHLIFRIASEEHFSDIYDMELAWHKNDIAIIDLFSFSRGEWESSMLSKFLVRYHMKRDNTGRFQRSKTRTEEIFNDIITHIEDSEYDSAFVLFEKLPEHQKISGNICMLYASVASKLGNDVFIKTIDEILAYPNRDVRFQWYWNFVKCQRTNDPCAEEYTRKLEGYIKGGLFRKSRSES